ncbi:MAG: CoA transferase [Deltaproteobacteria bacterium]|nr:CoA transferase [Deltaproteobacteria bacterium]MBI2532911.1 CoA transferase [Deltaproteobacteria bacterium]MBI3063509.1 CoA transferase [Deltaproteobacteria bacterium]
MVTNQQGTRALDGVKILAFEQVLSGPFATCLLADMGAEVIKVERPGVGDVIRSWDSVVKGLSSGYVWLNRNKRSLTVDVKKEKGKEILHELAKKSDIFFENYAPGVAGRLGVGYDTLSGLNQRLIYCSLSGYGQDGPYRDVKAYDLLIQGEGGIIATTGYPDKPARAGIAIADIASGMYAAIGILMALYQREKTDQGQFIDVSMLDSIVSWLGYFPHHYWHAGEEPARVGMRHHYVTPYGPYLAGDGEYVNLAVASASDWEVFCRKVIEKPALLEDPRFATVEGRRKNRAVLEETIENIFLERDHKHWLEQLKKAELPHGVVRGIAQVLAHPQVAARRLIREAESPVGKVPVIANALKMSASEARYDRIPALGEDNDTILREIGYDAGQIADLRRDKII